MQDNISKQKFTVPVAYFIICWFMFIYQQFSGVSLTTLALNPREPQGIYEILFFPILHLTTGHIVSNSIAFIVTLFFLYIFFEKVANKVFFICYLIPGILVWVFGRGATENNPAGHLGGSALIYGILFFLGSVGFFDRKPITIGISILFILFYADAFAGIIPDPGSGISWEGHASGAICGVACAGILGKHKDIDTMGPINRIINSIKKDKPADKLKE